MSTKYEALKNKLNENETYSQVNLVIIHKVVKWLNIFVKTHLNCTC